MHTTAVGAPTRRVSEMPANAASLRASSASASGELASGSSSTTSASKPWSVSSARSRLNASDKTSSGAGGRPRPLFARKRPAPATEQQRHGGGEQRPPRLHFQVRAKMPRAVVA